MSEPWLASYVAAAARKKRSRRGVMRETQLFSEQRGGELRKGAWPACGGKISNLASVHRQIHQSRRSCILASLRQRHRERRDARGAFLLPTWICSSGMSQRVTLGIKRDTRDSCRIALAAWRCAGGGRLSAWRLGWRRGLFI